MQASYGWGGSPFKEVRAVTANRLLSKKVATVCTFEMEGRLYKYVH